MHKQRDDASQFLMTLPNDGLRGFNEDEDSTTYLGCEDRDLYCTQKASEKVAQPMMSQAGVTERHTI